jgi:undecaprenyl-diphosphatase
MSHMTPVLAQAAPPVVSTSPRRAREKRCLHRDPPVSPSSFFREHHNLLLAAGAVFGFLALAAAIANGWLLMRWDRPLQELVESNRTGALDTFFLQVSRFGSTFFVLPVGLLMILLTWNRCRAVSVALTVATLGRPLLEFTVKELVERDRPDYERLVNGTGYSFPSGHVMAAVAIWGLLPLVVGLFTRSRILWWGSAIFAGGMILMIAASRVYLGVHWASDVFAGLLLGSFFLLGIEAVVRQAHRVGGCGAARRSEAAGRALAL